MNRTAYQHKKGILAPIMYQTFIPTLSLIVLIGVLPTDVRGASAETIPPTSIRTAVAHGVKQLHYTQSQWFKTQSCTSCHHSAMPTLALMAAREHGIRIDESAARQHFVRAFAFLSDLDLSIQASQIDPADDASIVVAASAGRAAAQHSDRCLGTHPGKPANTGRAVANPRRSAPRVGE